MSLKTAIAVMVSLEALLLVACGTYDFNSLSGVSSKPISRFNWTVVPSTTKLDPLKRWNALQHNLMIQSSSSDDEPSTRIDQMKPESKIGKKPYDFFVFPVFLPLLLLALGFFALPFRLFASPLKFLLGRRRRSIDVRLMSTSELARKCDAVDGKLPDYCLKTMKK